MAAVCGRDFNCCSPFCNAGHETSSRVNRCKFSIFRRPGNFLVGSTSRRHGSRELNRFFHLHRCRLRTYRHTSNSDSGLHRNRSHSCGDTVLHALVYWMIGHRFSERSTEHNPRKVGEGLFSDLHFFFLTYIAPIKGRAYSPPYLKIIGKYLPIIRIKF